jgi:catechol 2,3-dioxygenase-like lactoylglutathione lyase family enzyme
MGKLRHIAYRVNDLDAVARFFAEGFGMSIVQRRGVAIDLSDGTINITLLPAQREGNHGIDHIGFTVADEEAAGRAVTAAGGQQLNTIDLGAANYEVKFEGPEGIVVDLGHWAGTASLDD